MPSSIAITPSGPIDARVRPPGSKSISNRALVCAALADGRSTLTGALDSDDTRVMIAALRQLGIAIEWHDSPLAAHHSPLDTLHLPLTPDPRPLTPDPALVIDGCGGRIPAATADLFVGNSGTTVRFLTALAALGHGTYRFDGVPRMRERPIADLIDALRQLGGDVVSLAGNGCPPVEVRGRGLTGGRAEIRGDVSSQFLSGLLMAAPYAERDVELVVAGPLVSQPYVQMTLAVMSAFGIQFGTDELQRWVAGVESAKPQLSAGGEVATPWGFADSAPATPAGRIVVLAGQRYQPRDYAIEPDASAASYFFAAAAITGGRVTVEGLARDSLQGDVAFCECLRQMGCEVHYGDREITVVGGPLHGIEVDMNAISDTVQTLAAVALFGAGPTTIRGVAHIRHKETDRIGNLAIELRKLGAAVDTRADGLTITPAPLHAATLDTYDDHRMAMSLALAGLRVPGVVINDPECTAKTYPGFFTDLATL